jgi:hypothetical protein
MVCMASSMGDVELASTRGDRTAGARHVGIGLGELLAVVLVIGVSHDGRRRVDGIAGHQTHRDTVGSAQMDGRGPVMSAELRRTPSTNIPLVLVSKTFALRQLRSLAAHGGYPVRPGYRARRRVVLPSA